MAEHDAAVAAARAHLAAKPDPRRPLGPLPATFASTTRNLHLAAERVVQERRRRETGRGFLGFTAGGFGSIRWEHGETSGEPGTIHVDGIELVSDSGGVETRVPLAELPELKDAPPLDPEAAAALTDWNAFGTVVLADLIEGDAVDPEPIRLWPEHFDIATVVGSEDDGSRANVGVSPGDEKHSEPYIYVGPWAEVSGELWNASGFPGAELDHGELLEARDQPALAAEFIATRLAALPGDPVPPGPRG